MSIFNELKRRNVVKVGVAYAVSTWILLQLTDVVAEILQLPEWAPKLILLILVVGFVPALIFAWAFEMTPEGIKREKDVDRSQSITPQTGKKLNNTILVLMAVAIAYLLFDKFSVEGPDPIPTPATGVAENSLSGEPDPALDIRPEATPVINRQSIAVLPFDNRSRNIDDEYFTEGIHDDLLTNLARISSLKVISRTSVTQYKDTEKTIPVIAKELGVATVMEGAVQRSGNTVRINVQLIDAQTDEHLWAEIFDRQLTAENLFAIQSEISERIADALKATLSPDEESRINQFPTQSLEAYNAYLRGRQLLPQRNSADLRKAMEFFELAVEIDSEFALAWVGIAESANLSATHGTLSQAEKNKIVESAVARALEINPYLGEAYTSKGALHDDLNQWEEAETAYKRAIQLSPNYATTYHWYSMLVSNYNDRQQESLDLIKRAAELDPLSPIIKQNIAERYSRMGRFTEAEAEYRQLLAANPEFSSGMLSLGWSLYRRDLGRIDDAILMLQKSSRVDPGKIGSLVIEYFLWISLEDDARAQTVYQQMVDLDAENQWLPWAKAIMDIKHGRYAAAKEEAMYLGQKFRNPSAQWRAGSIFAWSGDYDLARAIFLKVDPRYLDREQWAEILNGGGNNVCAVGLTLVRTGDEALGNDLLRFAANYWEETLPLYIKHADRWGSFRCHAYLGDIEKSLAALETRLDHKHALSGWTYISMDPDLRLLREDPRFQAMDQKARAELTRQRENLARMEAEAGP